MMQIASRGQLRMAYVRYALFTVPAILLLGILSGKVANSGYENPWFDALAKPAFMPPGWAFPVAWTTLYILLGLSLAMILNARGARGRGVAVGIFLVQMALNLSWSPLFFAAHKVGAALLVILAMIALTLVSAWLFLRIRRTAAWLLLPYLGWLCFATALNYEIGRLNPDAERLVPDSGDTHIAL
jgi:tryptophan-rich sensory protein